MHWQDWPAKTLSQDRGELTEWLPDFWSVARNFWSLLVRKVIVPAGVAEVAFVVVKAPRKFLRSGRSDVAQPLAPFYFQQDALQQLSLLWV